MIGWLIKGMQKKEIIGKDSEEKPIESYKLIDNFETILLDIDDFGKINKEHGQNAGDRVLSAIGGTLKKALSGTKVDVARIGGEEINIIIPGDLTNEEKTEMIFNFVGMVQQTNIIQMFNFTEWVADNFIHLRGFWMFKNKNKGYHSTKDLFTVWANGNK